MRYLIIYDSNSGFTEITNTGVVEAETQEHAKEQFRKGRSLIPEAKLNMSAFPFDDLVDGWSYYR